MPNRSSNAKHIPTRTCVICKHKDSKANLFRFFTVESHFVIDCRQTEPGRCAFVCPEQECLGKLNKWILKKYKNKAKRGK